MDAPVTDVLRQHLIDPEICIRCNTCEETCPIGAISHDARNYVVDPAKCENCTACIAPCPTGAIDSWREVPRASAYTLAEQLGWDALPPGRVSIAWGTAWAQGGASCLAEVPSVIVPEESNLLINPRHPDARRIRARKLRRWLYDPRTLR